MFHPSRHRLSTILLTVAYLTATAAGGLLHDHADASSAHGAAAGCSHAAEHRHGPSGQCEADDLAGCGAQSSHGGTPHDDDCTVCRVAGQRVLPLAIVQVAPLCDVRVELTISRCDQPVVAPARTTHSRAPPVVG
jgi:hypothetical protein